MRPNNLRANWKKVTNTYGFDTIPPERRAAIREAINFSVTGRDRREERKMESQQVELVEYDCPDVCDVVTFVDQQGYHHRALVTAVHGYKSRAARNDYYRSIYTLDSDYVKNDPEFLDRALATPFVTPSINVVYVETDPKMHDPYGNQIARATSVPHQAYQSAPGFYYEF